MRLLLCKSSPPLSSPSAPLSCRKNPSFSPNSSSDSLPRLFTGVSTTAIAVSLSLLFSTPLSSIAFDASSILMKEHDSIKTELGTDCREQDDMLVDANETGPVTNKSIVEEAWQIVNDSFLDTGSRHWSPVYWLKKKEDILSTSIKTRPKAHEIIKRMLASLGDPYTRFLPPAEFSKMARYDMTGIGINLRGIPDENKRVKLKVLGLILDGPAHSAGVRQGDELLSVNGIDVRGKSAFEASSLLQGPSETFVDIKVKHGNCGPVQSIRVQRQSTARSPVFYRLEQVKKGPYSVGYIRLKEFNALARKDFVTAMKRLQDMGASYFVLDLRDNLGGLVQAGIEIAKLFLNEGETITYTVGRDTQHVKDVVAENPPLFSAPLVVLVNRNTASASEIVATALHDNCRAVLVGERTYGKGLIQSVFELRDGSGVVVTVGKYVTPGHVDINGNGLEPDFRNLPAWNEVTRHLSQCQRAHEG